MLVEVTHCVLGVTSKFNYHDIKIRELPTITNLCDLWLMGRLNYQSKKLFNF